ncbi:YihY/virulence factor BrkB family protein [Marinactinospora rubrisoli]|uniref:YihY/virulence factor BrkB family protein n=1 Tax=Marinactinospora rubrisoli TaxID=2715399 RepID=A0ABW2KDF0_9ACTN
MRDDDNRPWRLWAPRARAWTERRRRAALEWRDAHPTAGAAATVVVRAVRSGLRVRVVGLAAEAAFFSLLSLPALLLGLVGTLGHLVPVLGDGTVREIRSWLLNLAAQVLTADVVESVVAPLVDEFVRGARGGVLSVTFLVSLWSGSRAMSVFIDAITIAYGLEGLRGYLRQRVLAFVGYLGGLLFALVVLPVLVAGPDVVRDLLPPTGVLGIVPSLLHLAYWPVVGLVCLVCVTVLFALSVPVRTPVWRHLPGAVLAVLVLVLGSAALRGYLEASFGRFTIYGSLAAPIAVLAWFYVVALALLVGALLNAEIDAAWPTPATAAARAEVANRRHSHAARQVQRREEALRTVAEADAAPEPPAERSGRSPDRRPSESAGERPEDRPGSPGSTAPAMPPESQGGDAPASGGAANPPVSGGAPPDDGADDDGAAPPRRGE